MKELQSKHNKNSKKKVYHKPIMIDYEKLLKEVRKQGKKAVTNERNTNIFNNTRG